MKQILVDRIWFHWYSRHWVLTEHISACGWYGCVHVLSYFPL